MSCAQRSFAATLQRMAFMLYHVFPQVKTMTVEWKERFLVSNFAKTIEKEIEN